MTSTTLTIDQLATAAKSSTEAANPLAAILLKQLPRITYTRYNLQDADRRDLVQTAVAKAITNIDDYDPSRSFMTWVTSIMKNAYRDSLRRQNRRKETHGVVGTHDENGVNVADHSSSYEPDPAEQVLANDLERFLVKQLKPNRQHILEMSIAGLTASEISQALDSKINSNTVRWHQQIIHEELSEKYKKKFGVLPVSR